MNLLNTGAAWLEKMRNAHLSTAVWYKRGDKQIGVPATIGKTVFKTSDDYGRLVYVESRDYLINAGDLQFDDGQPLPLAGDSILEDGNVYEVMAPAGEPSWRYSDINRHTFRIHTKQTEGW